MSAFHPTDTRCCDRASYPHSPVPLRHGVAPRKPNKPMKPKFSQVFICLPLILIGVSHAQSTFLNSADGGNWGDPANWTAGVPDVIGAQAIVNGTGPSGTAPATWALDVVLDDVYTIGKLTRTANTGPDATARPATFPTGPDGMDPAKGLLLKTAAGQPELEIAVGDVFYYSAIFGEQGFRKTGDGRLTFRFNTIDQVYTGNVTIDGGTLGIQKNSSLGDDGNDLFIATGARLLAEPSSNSGNIVLPASRTVTLTGADARLGATPVAVNLVVEGEITDAGLGFGPTKTDSGTLTLAGANSWTGTTTVNGGTLVARDALAFPAAASQSYVANNTAILAVRFGTEENWTAGEIANLLGKTTFNGNSSFGIDTSEAFEAVALSLDLAGTFGVTRLAKVGQGTLSLANSPGLARITLAGGVLELAADSLPAGDAQLHFAAGGSSVELGESDVTLARVVPVAGGTGFIDGASASLTVNGDFNFEVNSTNNTRLNLSGLDSFTYNRPNRAFRCIPATAGTNSFNELILAYFSNTITSDIVQIGAATGTSEGNAHEGQLRLGSDDTFNTSQFRIGGFNGSGVVNHQPGTFEPIFRLRGIDGVSAAALLRVGETSSGVRSGAGVLDLGDATVDILTENLLVARHNANSNNGNTSTLTFSEGTLTVTDTLRLVQKQGGGTPTLFGTINQNGAAAVITHLRMAETLDNASPNVASATQNLRANYHLNAGTLSATTIAAGSTTTPITAGTTERNLHLNGGTLQPIAGSNLTITGVTVRVPIDSTAIIASGPDQQVGFDSSSSIAFQIDSGFEEAARLTVTGSLSLAGSLVLTDLAESPEPLAAGTSLTLIDYAQGSLSGIFDGLADGAAVSIGDQGFVIDYGGLGGTAVTLTATAASGGNYASWAQANGIAGEPFDGDFDNDGIPNGVEYALGLDPTRSGQATGVFAGNTITFTKGVDAIANGDVGWTIETSTTLAAGSWVEEVSQPAGDPAAAISYTFTPGSPAKQFARLKAIPVP